MSFAQSNLSIAEKSAIHFKDNHDFDWQCDVDNESSKCQVWLWTRPIGGREDETRTHRHWAFVFEWSDRVVTYEAINTHGYIHPKWFEGRPKDSDIRWNQRTIEDIGTYLLSPMEVNSAAKKNRFNCCQFSYGHVNCQHWAVILGEDLNITVPESLAIAEPWYAIAASSKGFIDKHKTGILIGTAALGIGVGIGIGIAAAVSKSKDKEKDSPI